MDRLHFFSNIFVLIFNVNQFRVICTHFDDIQIFGNDRLAQSLRQKVLIKCNIIDERKVAIENKINHMLELFQFEPYS